MSFKAKLTSMLIGVIFALAMMIVGVLSVTQVNLGIGGNVTFTAKGVNCTISEGTLNDTSVTKSCTYTKDGSYVTKTGSDVMPTMTFSTDEDIDNSEKLLAWTGLDLNFGVHGEGADKNKLIINFTITNNSDTDSIVVSIIDSETATNSHMKTMVTNGPKRIAASGSGAYSITFEPENPDVNASLNGFNVTFKLEHSTDIVTGSWGSPVNYRGYSVANSGIISVNETELKKNFSDGHVIIPSGNLVSPDGDAYGTVSSISDNAFKSFTWIKMVTLNNITRIGESAFEGCTSLNEIKFVKNIYLGDGAFAGCTSLTSITFQGDISSSGGDSYTKGVFAGCENLANVNFVGYCHDIGNYMFSGCSSLTSVILPDNIEYIGKGAFSGCTNLTSVTFPEGKTTGWEYGPVYSYRQGDITEDLSDPSNAATCLKGSLSGNCWMH